jgi:hypothetical protein
LDSWFTACPRSLDTPMGIVFSFLNDTLCKMQDGFVVKACYPRGWLVSRRFELHS